MSMIHSTIEYKGFTIKIEYHPQPCSPREAFDNLGTMYTSDIGYQPEESFQKHFQIEDVCPDELGTFGKKFLQEYIALPIYLYDHSGQTVSTTPFSCPWDSGFMGIIAISIENVRQVYNWRKITKKRRSKIESYLLGEVKTYDDYLTGSVYGFTVEDEQGNEIDSCYGYYGDNCIPEIEKECKSSIDYIINKRRVEKFKSNIGYIKNFGKQLFLPFTEYPEFTL